MKPKPTKRLYYEEPEQTKFDAKVVEVIDNKDESFELILDRTLFYPEGGGQPSDIGIISSEDVKAKVTDVQIEGGIIFHSVDENIKVGSTVKGEIDSSRRRRLMRHHTATHILVHSARQLLGEHIRQAGAQKGVDNSRVDIQHYRKISREDIRSIEAIANEIIVEKDFIKPEVFMFTDKYIGIPIFCSIKNKHISLEHTHPPHEYIMSVDRFSVVNELKKEFGEIIN